MRPGENKRNFELLLNASPDPIFVSRIDNYRFTTVNQRACENYGYTREEFLEMEIFDIETHEPVREEVRALYDNTPIGQVLKVEGVNKRKDGTTFPVEVRFTKINDDFALAIVRDISEGKEAEEKLQVAHDELEQKVKERTTELEAINAQLRTEIGERKQAEEQAGKLSRAIAQTADLVVITDKEGAIEYVNPAFEKLTGYTSEEAVGSTPRILKSGQHPKDFYEQLWATIKSGDTFRGELINKKKNGELYYEEKTITPIIDVAGEITHYVSTGKDLTERINAVAELKDSHIQLRALYAHLQSLGEEERKAIAREIHDELGQALTALQMDLFWLRNALPTGDKSLIDKIDSMSRVADETLLATQRISTELRPELLDTLGISEAIEWQLEEFQKRTTIECELSIESSDTDIDQDRSIALYRIFQESLTNVARHADATKVKVSLSEMPGALLLKVVDNGKGITKKQLDSPLSMGLIGMRERLYPWGGQVEIKSRKGRGTTLTATVPLIDG